MLQNIITFLCLKLLKYYNVVCENVESGRRVQIFYNALCFKMPRPYQYPTSIATIRLVLHCFENHNHSMRIAYDTRAVPSRPVSKSTESNYYHPILYLVHLNVIISNCWPRIAMNTRSPRSRTPSLLPCTTSVRGGFTFSNYQHINSHDQK